jgi:hypothetical protein
MDDSGKVRRENGQSMPTSGMLPHLHGGPPAGTILVHSPEIYRILQKGFGCDIADSRATCESKKYLKRTHASLADAHQIIIKQNFLAT